MWIKVQKTSPVWAREAVKEQNIQTLEGAISIKPGEMICRGVEGELWAQNKEGFFAKYIDSGEKNDKGWSKYLPDPQKTLYAFELLDDRQLNIGSGILEGKKGDFIVTSCVPPVDFSKDKCWIVKKEIFESTYKIVNS